MVLVILGSQDYKFERLINAIDTLANNNPEEQFLIQQGKNTYTANSTNVKFFEFMAAPEFNKKMNEAKVIISHGGVASILGALKQDKVVIAFPRLVDFGEQIDNHQVEIVDKLSNENYILKADETNINEVYKLAESWTPKKYFNDKNDFIKNLDMLIKGEQNGN